jgi:hypothetical protein
MTLMKVTERAGFTLVYDTDDVEHCTVSTPHDVYDVSPSAGGGVRRELGQAHLILRVDFKLGKQAMWVKGAEGVPE